MLCSFKDRTIRDGVDVGEVPCQEVATGEASKDGVAWDKCCTGHAFLAPSQGYSYHRPKPRRRLRATVTIDERMPDQGDQVVYREVGRYRVPRVEDFEVKDGGISVRGAVQNGEIFRDDCAHCGKRDAYQSYHVKKEVWALTGLDPKAGVLHIWCLEEMIGRRVTADDLSDASWNDLLKHVMRP